MVKPRDLLACYHCGWLGMCIVACPLVDPTQVVSRASHSASDLDLRLDDSAFEIAADEKTQPTDEDSY